MRNNNTVMANQLLDREIKQIEYQEFMNKMRLLDIYEDRRYKEPWCILPSEGARITIRLPEKFTRWRKVVLNLLRAMTSDCLMYVWRRKMINSSHEITKNEMGVLPFLLEKLHGISENGGGYCFSWKSFDVLCELCLAHMYAAESTRQDLFIVPSDGKGVVYFDHHEAIYVCGKDTLIGTLRQMFPDASWKQSSQNYRPE